MKSTQKKSWRVQEVLRLLQSKERTIKEICYLLQIDYTPAAHRAILRDLNDLRDQGHEIEPNDKRPLQYKLLASPPPRLQPEEALAVHVALRLLYHHSNNPPRSYLNALEKITAMLPNELRHIARRSMPNNLGSEKKFWEFEKIANSWIERRRIRFNYLALNTTSNQVRQTELEVYFVEVSRSNFEIYVIGRRVNHPPFEVRTFLLSLMQGVTPLNQNYQIPEDFDPQVYLSNAWGVIGDRDPMLVRLRFDAGVKRWLQGRRFPGVLDMSDDEQGNLLVTIQTGKNSKGEPQELIPWIRGWGAKVEVLEPQGLREIWLNDARAVIEKFGGE